MHRKEHDGPYFFLKLFLEEFLKPEPQESVALPRLPHGLRESCEACHGQGRDALESPAKDVAHVRASLDVEDAGSGGGARGCLGRLGSPVVPFSLFFLRFKVPLRRSQPTKGALIVMWLLGHQGEGYGDCSEAFGKFHQASDLQFLSDLFAFVPVPWTGSATSTGQLHELVEQLGVQSCPLLVFDLTFPELERSSMQTLAWALRPDTDLGGARLVAMGCYMEDQRQPW